MGTQCNADKQAGQGRSERQQNWRWLATERVSERKRGLDSGCCSTPDAARDWPHVLELVCRAEKRRSQCLWLHLGVVICTFSRQGQTGGVTRPGRVMGLRIQTDKTDRRAEIRRGKVHDTWMAASAD